MRDSPKGRIETLDWDQICDIIADFDDQIGVATSFVLQDEAPCKKIN